jgi:hypothetical protein
MDDLEESQAAIGVLGGAVHALDTAAYDAGYQVDLKITRLASEKHQGPGSPTS